MYTSRCRQQPWMCSIRREMLVWRVFVALSAVLRIVTEESINGDFWLLFRAKLVTELMVRL